MKKPLLDESEIFLSHVEGRISAWDSSVEDVLVEAANQGLKHTFDQTTLLLPELMVFERAVAIWLTRVLNEGVTARLIDDLNKETSNIRYRRLLALEKGASPCWHNIADLDDDLNPEIRAAYAISHLVGSGAFRRLRQCQDDGCDRFFLGPPNAKWCSARCGSRARGRDKRKRDRARGVIT